VRAFTGGYRLSLNMLVMLDDFTPKTGGTLILSGSHRREAMPSSEEFAVGAEQIVGKAGDIVLFDSLTVHSAAPNRSADRRRALTLCLGRPFMKPQMDWPRYLSEAFQTRMDDRVRQLMGFKRPRGGQSRRILPAARALDLQGRSAMSAASERRRLDAVVASYGEAYAPFDAAMRSYMMRTLSPFFRDGPCLQVGCAHGDQTSLLAERFGDLTVVEAARAFLEAAAARATPGVRFVQSLIEDFETDDRYETILFSHVLEHVADPIGR